MPDIDIDFADRDNVLSELPHIPASIIKNGEIRRHNTGIYLQDMPVDPVSGLASIDYQIAEELGYFKFDFLNLGTYKRVRDYVHLDTLLNTEPDWSLLEDEASVNELIHLKGNFAIVNQLKPRNIEEIAIVLAIKLPCKRYLIYRPWSEIRENIWRPVDGEYVMRRSHSLAYSHVVKIEMNLLTQQRLHTSN